MTKERKEKEKAEVHIHITERNNTFYDVIKDSLRYAEDQTLTVKFSNKISLQIA